MKKQFASQAPIFFLLLIAGCLADHRTPGAPAEKTVHARLNPQPEVVSVQSPAPGPENQGLRLRLAIETTHRDGQDYHTVRMGIVNVSSAPITLVATPAYESQAQDYARYLKAETSFITFPEILPPSAQTALDMAPSAPAKITIPPREAFTTQWQSQGGLLKDTGYYNTAPYLPGPGLYSVRARIMVTTTSDRDILLYSNEQTVSIGRSMAMPKHATAKIIRVDQEENTVTINVGAHHKIQVGDEFYCAGPFPNYWKLNVIQIRPWNSEASVMAHNASASPNDSQPNKIDSLPPLHAVAQLWCFPPPR